MDHLASKEHDNSFDVDLESGTGIIHSSPDQTVLSRLCDGLMSVEDDSSVKPDSLTVSEGSLENNIIKSKKASSAKKPPRPPRPLSLDASDQKLVKELTEIAMIKRARVERMKALKQKKNLKLASSSSSSSSSHGSLFAMLITVIFFIMILFQGQNSGVTIQGQGPGQTGQSNVNGLTIIQNQFNISPSDSGSPDYKT
ncbi:uncharacterized protein LOC143541343 [Bidens hawaiensis]|uniref:uncharacterized protein LOC143541343 n=1 Tax=Bidens hawaiensis TaxID=980011 RepID=UPI00404AF0DC